MTTQASLVSRETYLAERSIRRNSDVKRSGWLLSIQFLALPTLHASRFTVFLFATAFSLSLNLNLLACGLVWVGGSCGGTQIGQWVDCAHGRTASDAGGLSQHDL